MTSAIILMILGTTVIVLSKFLGQSHMWWYKTFFRSWADIEPWFPRAGYITLGVILLLIGIYGLGVEASVW